MLVLRCTKKLLSRLRAPPAPAPSASTTHLGDWYANLIFIRRLQLVLFVAERCLLPVLVEAKPSSTLLVRFRTAVGRVLSALEIPRAAVESELEEMVNITIAKTASRSVLGTMNDFAWMAEHHLAEAPALLEVSLALAETPCSPIDGFPCDSTREAFGMPPRKNRFAPPWS